MGGKRGREREGSGSDRVEINSYRAIRQGWDFPLEGDPPISSLGDLNLVASILGTKQGKSKEASSFSMQLFT